MSGGIYGNFLILKFSYIFVDANSGLGNGSAGSTSTAKSCEAVGAAVRGSSAGGIASFSSGEPKDDNIIKEGVTIWRSNIVSASNDLILLIIFVVN